MFRIKEFRIKPLTADSLKITINMRLSKQKRHSSHPAYHMTHTEDPRTLRKSITEECMILSLIISCAMRHIVIWHIKLKRTWFIQYLMLKFHVTNRASNVCDTSGTEVGYNWHWGRVQLTLRYETPEVHQKKLIIAHKCNFYLGPWNWKAKVTLKIFEIGLWNISG